MFHTHNSFDVLLAEADRMRLEAKQELDSANAMLSDQLEQAKSRLSKARDMLWDANRDLARLKNNYKESMMQDD